MRVELENFLNEKKIEYQEIYFDILGGEVRKDISNSQICKTLVLKGKNIYIVSIPIDKKLSYKKIKEQLNDKKIHLASNVEEVSGYPHGANGPVPIFLNHSEYIYIFDNSFKKHDKLISNSGKRSHTILINRKKLVELVDGIYLDCLE